MALDRFKLLYDWGVKKENLALNPNLTPEQIDLLYQDKGVSKQALARFPKLTDEQFMRLFNEGQNHNADLITSLSGNRNLTPEQIDLLYETKGLKEGISKRNLAQYPKLTEEQFMRFFNEGLTPDSDLISHLTLNPHLTPEQIELLYQTEGVNKHYLARFPKLTDEQFMRFFNGGQNQNADLITPLTANPNLTPEQIDLLYQTKGLKGISKRNLAQYPKLTQGQFMRFFTNDAFNKDRLAKNPNLTTEQIDLLYQTKGVDKDLLAQSPKLTDEQFLRAFNDGKTDKNFLALNPSINPDSEQVFTKGIFNWKW